MMAQVTDLQLVMRMMGGPSDCQTITYTMDFPTTQHYNGTFQNMSPFFKKIHLKANLNLAHFLPAKNPLKEGCSQAFRFFGWLTVTPMLASHLLTCAVAVWMGGLVLLFSSSETLKVPRKRLFCLH